MSVTRKASPFGQIWTLFGVDEGSQAAPAFSPETLFASGELGDFFDPWKPVSFTDLAGTVPATTGKRVAALRGERNSMMLTSGVGNQPYLAGVPLSYGPELVSNPRFDSATGWTLGTGWTISGGRAGKTAGTLGAISLPISLTAEKIYLVQFNCTITAGSLNARFNGGSIVNGLTRTQNGSYAGLLRAVTGNNAIEMFGNAAFAGTVDNVSVREVTEFAIPGLVFDGVVERMGSALNLSGGSVITIIASFYNFEGQGARVFAEYGNFAGNQVGSMHMRVNAGIQLNARGASGIASVTNGAEGQSTVEDRHFVMVGEVDLNAPLAEQVRAGQREVFPTTPTNTAASGGGNLSSGPFTIMSSGNGVWPCPGIMSRFLVINRKLTADERQNAVRWAARGCVFGAVLGDSVVATNDFPSGMNANIKSLASYVPGLVTGPNFLAYPGDQISMQRTKWISLTDKNLLRAVIVQVGLNDCNTFAITKTAAQIIADYQSLIDLIRTDVPNAKILVAEMTPARVWLGNSTDAALAYAHWQALNQAIRGEGPTPITGVDFRITAHKAALADVNDNLAQPYDYRSDGVHPGSEGKIIIAQAWRDALIAQNLLIA